MGKFVLFTDNHVTETKFNRIFNNGDLKISKSAEHLSEISSDQVCIIDDNFLNHGDFLAYKSDNPQFSSPVVYIIEKGERQIMDLLDNGVVSIIRQDDDDDRIKSKLDSIRFNVEFIGKMKALSNNSAKTGKFFSLFNSITSDASINETIENILESVHETFEFNATSFYLVIEKRLKHKITIGGSPNNKVKQYWAIGKEYPDWLKMLLKENSPVIVTKDSDKSLLKSFRRGTVLLPLIMKNRITGLIIGTVTPEGANLNELDVKLLKAYGDQTSVVLENAQLYWNVIKAQEELIKQEKKNLLGQMIISLNHEINNPLSIISMEAQLLQKKFENKESKIESRIANIENNIERIKSILEKISSLNIENHTGIGYINGQEMLNLNSVN